jgi:hypothetical protein
MAERSFHIRHSADIDADPEVVSGLLLDPSTWPQWQPEISQARGPAPMEKGDVARGRAKMLGFAVHGHSEALRVADGVFEEDVIVGVRMVIRYEVRPSPSGVRVTHELTALLPGGVSGRVLSLFLRPRLRALQRGALRHLAVQADLRLPESSRPSSP